MGFFDDVNDKIEKDNVNKVSLAQGNYGARIELTLIDLEKSPVEVGIKYKIIRANDEQYLNQYIWSNYRMTGPSKAFFFKTMKLLGKHPEECKTLSDAADMLHSTKEMECEIYIKLTAKKTMPGEFWENAYCNGMLNHAKFSYGVKKAEKQDDGIPSFDADDEIPF